MLTFSGERIVPEADNCEPLFALKMYQEHIARYLFASQVAQGKAVLDVGCGVGYGSQLLARKGATNVTAFDIAEKAIFHAREFYPHPNVEYLVASAEDFSFQRKFDLVTCFELIEHLPHQHAAVKRVADSLSDDGLLVMSTPRPAGQKQRSAFHVRELDYLDFSNLLECYFPHVEWFFENNHFSSIVAGTAPDEIRAIHRLHQQFGIGQADYFIAVASRSPIRRELFQSQLVLNNDAYVKNLERDVDILHRAENDLKGHAEALNTEVSMLRAEREPLHIALENANGELQRKANDLETTKVELGAAHAKVRAAEQLRADSAEVSRLRQELAAALVRSAEYEERSKTGDQLVAELRAELRKTGSALEQLRNGAADEVRQVRDELTQEISGWQQAALSFEAQLHSIFVSRSWKLTKPLRSVAFHLRGIKPPDTSTSLPATVPIESQPLSTDSQLVGPSEVTEAAEFCHAADTAVLPQPSRQLDVLYIVGCHEGESKRYRAYNFANALTRLGFRAEAVPDSEVANIIERRDSARIFVLFRCAYSESIERLLEYCRASRITTIFDIDDLVFEPESIGHVHVLNTFSHEDRAAYLRDVVRYQETLHQCDRATCTTSYLAQRISALGKPVHVLPNSLNDSQLAAIRHLPTKNANAEQLRIGYFSGSNTHQADFASCEDALLDVMSRYSQVRLVLVGILDLGSEWDRFVERVERYPIVPYCEMLRILAGVDVNLAPLEVGNPYCEGKSQLKIFEAALASVPTIASSTQSYKEAIEHGVDGFLASTKAEWLSALEHLINSDELRRRIALGAKERALHQFGPEQVARQAAQIYGFHLPTASYEADTRTKEPLKITWIVPGIIVGGGGHRNILRAAYHLERFGHYLELYFTSTELDSYELKETVRSHFYPLNCPMHRYVGDISSTDVLFATHWSTVDAAVRARREAGELMYFVQDFEPSFAPMGTEYILAENTYRLGLYHITSGPWCEHFLKEQFKADADHFLFPVDRSIYSPAARIKMNPTVVFFAKPEMPRRCFELGVMALEHFHRLRPDVEVVMFGSSHLQEAVIPFPAKVLSIVPTLQDLAAIYTNADLGIVFSTTNPSLVPYEMMACGLPVVDLNRPGNEINYGGREDIAFLADPSPDVMAQQMRELLDDQQQLSERSRKGLQFVHQFPSEEQMGRRVEELILQRMERYKVSRSVAFA